MNLKKGKVAFCGAPGKPFGSVDFAIPCNEQTKKDFNFAIELLHSFEYDEAEKIFAKIIDENPGCVMAYWGVAMCNFHPLWTPPTEAELQKGNQAIEIANTIPQSEKESAYINAIATFYKNWKEKDHQTRCINYEKAMEKIYKTYPEDREASIFYALALVASSNPLDSTYSNQKKAGTILQALYPAEPDHPGIIHYIIHTYDYPGLAELALPAARKYAEIAPYSAHALHMPSHTFTRLGLWEECIKSNLASVASATCYAEEAGIKGHWDEELHGMDYLTYAYLQKGENKLVKEQLKNLETIKEVYPVNIKVAYAFAAIPSRFLLENKYWDRAATLEVSPANFSWEQFPWQKSIIHFTRLLGAAHLRDIKDANVELTALKQLHSKLEKQKDAYKSSQVAIQIKTGEAWILLATGKTFEALNLMKRAADMEDLSEKHPVTPGEVLPARELLGDMLIQAKQYENAFTTYEAVLTKCPNRFNSLYGAGLAAEKSGRKEKAELYFKKLLSITHAVNSDRPELTTIRKRLKVL